MNPTVEPQALAIPMGYVLLAAILLWGIIGSKGYWWLKLLAITCVMFFGVSLWYSLNTYLGWPSRAEMPPKYMVYWAYVQEPSKKDNDEGAVFFMVRHLEENKKVEALYALQYQANAKDPRVYRVEYSRDLHQQVNQMLAGIKKGQVFIGGKNAPKGKGQGQGKGKGEGKEGQGRGHGPGYKGDGKGENGSFSFSYRSKDMYIYPLPPPKIPDKITDQ